MARRVALTDKQRGWSDCVVIRQTAMLYASFDVKVIRHAAMTLPYVDSAISVAMTEIIGAEHMRFNENNNNLAALR